MKKQLLLACLVFLPAFGFSESPPTIVAETLAKTNAAWNGDLLPAYPSGQPEVTLLKITIPPRTSLPWHKHPVINVGYLLAGELRVTAENGQVLHLTPGDSIVELVDQWHFGENPGDVPAVILVFYAGAENKPVTVLKPEDALPATPLSCADGEKH